MLNACNFCCQRANIMLLCVLSASASPCIMLLWSPTRQNACLMLLRRRRRQHDACHCRRPSQTTPSHHVQSSRSRRSIMMMTTTLVIGPRIIIIARSGRGAPRPPCSDRSGCCGRTRRAANANDDNISAVPASTAVFFGCRRYRDASVDTEFFAR